MSLARLLEQATPGPWTVQPGVKGAVRENHEEHAALVALAPDMARLLIDMAEWIEYAHEHVETRHATDEAVYESLRARYAELDAAAVRDAKGES